MAPLPEPWMRGPIESVDARVAPLLYSFEQAREDLAKHTEGLSTEQLWATPHGFGSVAFHIRHIGGSTERLMTYLEGRQLSAEQMAAFEAEKQPDTASRDELLASLDAALRRAEQVVRRIDPATLAEAREVGRKKLPTTVAGLLTHIAEHMQRHVGQAISAAKWARVQEGVSIAPMLSVRNGRKALEFYKAAFGATEVFKIEDAGGAVVAKLSVEGAEFWVADESPEHQNFSPESLGGGTVRMVVVLRDPDAAFERAVAAGAKAVVAVANEYGWRLGRVADPFGHHWEIGKPLQ